MDLCLIVSSKAKEMLSNVFSWHPYQRIIRKAKEEKRNEIIVAVYKRKAFLKNLK